MTETKRGKYERTEEIKMKISQDMKDNNNAFIHGRYSEHRHWFCDRCRFKPDKDGKKICSVYEPGSACKITTGNFKFNSIDDKENAKKEFISQLNNLSDVTEISIMAEAATGRPNSQTTKLRDKKMMWLFKLLEWEKNNNNTEENTTQEQPK